MTFVAPTVKILIINTKLQYVSHSGPLKPFPVSGFQSSTSDLLASD